MPHPDLEIRGGNHPEPLIGGGGVSKKIFSALWASVWSKNRRRVDFYTHVVETTPGDGFSRRRIWRYGLKIKIKKSATAKGHFQACALSHFGAFLLPAAVVEVAVTICLTHSLLEILPKNAF